MKGKLNHHYYQFLANNNYNYIIKNLFDEKYTNGMKKENEIKINAVLCT